jgi:type I restriction enzyme S subunit
MTTNQGFKSIIPKKINYEFLYYSMLAKKHVFQRLGNGSTFLEVPKKDFEKITLEVPESMEEQLKIAFVLSNIDKEIQLFGSKLEALKTQKKGLMQQLLTGKVRVQVKD